MDLFAEKIEIAHFRGEEVAFPFDEIRESRTGEISTPLRGVLIGLLLSVPIWAIGFLLFEIF
ncbi:hypothetical protein [Sphingomonas azotifigens]|uniref:hypothetical protein n=1 Tax=Sphingomonas azotifigens TaxID=330920 RepID=UPI000A05282E|nr:hypothetical protein [Sphingomonas azotifigens]